MAISSEQGSTQKGEMPYRTLGKTGEKVSCIGLGGFHLGQSRLEEADAVKLFQAAVDRGINFSDNSWDYNQGESERRVGKALQGQRDKVFVMRSLTDARRNLLSNNSMSPCNDWKRPPRPLAIPREHSTRGP